MSALVIAKGNDGTQYFYGPFHDGEQASAWAHQNLKGFEWYWEDLIRPGSTYLTTVVEDIVDFIESTTEESYVTINGVNWTVLPSR